MYPLKKTNYMAQSNANWRDELATDEEEQNNDQDRDILKLSSLTPADVATVTFLSDGEVVETEFEDEDGEKQTVRQLRVPVVLEDVSDRILDGDNVPAETGKEYVILSAASSFINPLAEAFDDLEGETVHVGSAGDGRYDGYEVET